MNTYGPSMIYPAQIFTLKSWLESHPPVPAVMQSILIRFLLRPDSANSDMAIYAVQFLSTFLIISAFLMLSKVLEIQAGKWPAFLFFILCLAEYSILQLNATPMAEPFALFFTAYATLISVKFANNKYSIIWPAILAVSLSFFSRNETFIVAFTFSIYLYLNAKFRQSIQMILITMIVVISKLCTAIFFNNSKFYRKGIDIYIREDQWEYLRQFFQELFKTNIDLMTFIGMIVCLLTVQSLKNGRSNLSIDYKKIIKSHEFLWLTSIVFSCLILIEEIVRGNSNFQPRFLFLANIFINGFFSLLIIRSFKNYSKFKSLFNFLFVPFLLIVSIVSLRIGYEMASGTFKIKKNGIRNWGSFRTNYNDWIFEKEQIEFLRRIKMPEDIVAFDELGTIEDMITAYLLTYDNWRYYYFGYENRVNLWALIPKQIVEKINSAILFTTIHHAYLYASKAKYMVIYSQAAYDKMSKRNLPRNGMTTGFYRNYLEKLDPEQGVYSFRSPYISNAETINFKKIYEDSRYITLQRVN